jgi:hypothetical protein
MHALTSLGVNEGDTDETRLPPPEQPLLTRLNEPQVTELIECHVEYVSGERAVRLPYPFVRAFHMRTDDALPLMAAIATLPIVLPGRTLLSGRGLDRERGIVFRVPPELEAMLPQPENCTPTAVAKAMRFLTDEWLCDIAADYAGKCILIAAALSIIERSLLPDRPVFFITAGRRGSGKTTTLVMLVMAVTGTRPAAAAWSRDDEERRKALLAYLMEGRPSSGTISRAAPAFHAHISRKPAPPSGIQTAASACPRSSPPPPLPSKCLRAIISARWAISPLEPSRRGSR